MLIIFVTLFALGVFGAMSLQKEYTSNGRILVQFGEEYIYNPIIGTAGQGTAYSTDQMIQAEVGFFTANVIRERVLKNIGLRRIFPELAAQYEADPANRDQIWGEAVEEIGKNLGAYTAPNQPLISVNYRNENPEVSAQVLNAIMDEYLVYRREILLDGGNSRFGNERKTTEVKLTEINRKLAIFLNANNIGDFLVERNAAGVRFAALNDLLLAATARRQEIDAGIRAREDRLALVPVEILQFTDDSSSSELANLKIQREQLLARYKPGSKPVRALDANILRLQNFIAAGKSKDLGIRRTGVNLVHQTLQSEKLSLESEAQSNAQRITVLTAQIAQVRNKQRKMQKLFPEFQRLAGKAEVLQTAVQQFSSREEEYQARRNLAEQASNNIRIIERPVVPFEGKSMKRPAAILALLFAGFTALMVGLAIVFSKIAKNAPRGNVPPNNSYPSQSPVPPYPGQQRSTPPMMRPRATMGAVPVAAGIGANALHPQMQEPAPYGYHYVPPAANQSDVQPGSTPAGGLPILANINHKGANRS